MNNFMEEHKKLLEEENRLLHHLKQRMLAGDDEKTLIEITAQIDEMKEKSNRIIHETLSLGAAANRSNTDDEIKSKYGLW